MVPPGKTVVRSAYRHEVVPPVWVLPQGLLRRNPTRSHGALSAMPYTYILKSLKDKGYYYGSCHILEKRFKNHCAGKVKSTKHRRPLKIHYYEEFATMREARRRELFFKSISGYNRL